MSNTPNKNEKPAEPKRMGVATQKTFKFPRRTKTELIDKVVNAWLLDQSLKGTPAQLGKTYTSGGLFNRYVYMVYMFTRFVPIPTNPPQQPLKKAE